MLERTILARLSPNSTLAIALIIFSLVLAVHLYPGVIGEMLAIDARKGYVDANYCVTVCEKADVHNAFSAGVFSGGVAHANISIFNVFLPLIAFLLYLLLPNRSRLLDVLFAVAMMLLWVIFDAPHFLPTDLLIQQTS